MSQPTSSPNIASFPPPAAFLAKLKLPDPSSHKGQNGKLLVIGGSELFHAASKWSLDTASHFVDMVFYSSVPSNNQLVQAAKGEFWNGIVVDRAELLNYVAEADCILIGPGMTRTRKVSQEWTEQLLSIVDWQVKPSAKKPAQRVASRLPNSQLSAELSTSLSAELDWDHDTYGVTNFLLAKYPDKKWVLDAGALQMVEPYLLNKNMIITPHYQELAMVLDHLQERVQEWETAHQGEYEDIQVGRNVHLGGRYASWSYTDFDPSWSAGEQFNTAVNQPCAEGMASELGEVTLLLKGQVDTVVNGEVVVPVPGGNPGLTKGGTGDVLAGLVAALYCSNDPLTAAVVGSYINKKAGDLLYQTQGPFFNSSELVQSIPTALWQELAALPASMAE